MKKSELKQMIHELLEEDNIIYKTSSEIWTRMSAIVKSGGTPPKALVKKYYNLISLGK